MTKAEKIIDLLDRDLCLFARDFFDIPEENREEIFEMITKIIEGDEE
jgi:hypothetical protein